MDTDNPTEIMMAMRRAAIITMEEIAIILQEEIDSIENLQLFCGHSYLGAQEVIPGLKRAVSIVNQSTNNLKAAYES